MNKFHFIGLHILFFTSIAHSYVLFTANIEDVRKLARKFVSESLAEQIADFIARATQQMVTNVSEENGMNADNFDEPSDRDNKITRNIGRQRYEKVSDKDIYTKTSANYKDQNNHAYEMVIKKRPHKPYDYEDKVVNIHESQSKLRPTGPKQSTIKRKILVKKRKVSSTRTKPKPMKQKSTPKLKSKPTIRLDKRFDTQTKKQGLYRNKIIYDQKRKLSEKNKEYQGIPSRQMITSTLGYAEKFLNEDQSLYSLVTNPTNLEKTINKNQYILASMNSNETPKNDSFIDVNKTLGDMQKFTIEEYNLKRASADVTTKKERTEFDQYDNKNYPKAEFIATSGPVALPKLPVEKPWWERAIPNQNTHKDNSWI